MLTLISILKESWHMLMQSAPYMVFGLTVAGLLRGFIDPQTVVKHLGIGRFSSVIKAALIGVPMPLCSCGVLPTAASLKKQGATNGAVSAFLIATPESGVDSIAVSYALLDPILTVARPLAAFINALVAGFSENLFWYNTEQEHKEALRNDSTCCNGVDCPPHEHKCKKCVFTKLKSGLAFSYGTLWNDLAGAFCVGVLVSGLISALVPSDILSMYLGGGLSSMLIVVLVAIPMYVCASASTPIAASLILKGVSPGTALVFLLAGPATNAASITVLFRILGKRATAIYLTSIAVMSIISGLLLDAYYSWSKTSAAATIGHAGAHIPQWVSLAAIGILIIAYAVSANRK